MATRTVFKDEMRPAIGPTPGPWRYLRHDGAIVHDQSDQGAREIGWNDADYMLAAAAPDMLAVLRDLEWIGMNDGRGVTHAMCPACSALKSRGSGHNPHCGLAAAIVKAEGL